jgi:predicted GIY-YIG superfamily endonuclease
MLEQLAPTWSSVSQNTRQEPSSSLRRPVTLVFSELFDRIEDAVTAERQIKGWRREKKEA